MHSKLDQVSHIYFDFDNNLFNQKDYTQEKFDLIRAHILEANVQAERSGEESYAINDKTVLFAIQSVTLDSGAHEMPNELALLAEQGPAFEHALTGKNLEKLQEDIAQLNEKRLTLFEGVKETLDFLREQGKTLIVFSECNAYTLAERLQFMGIADKFTAIYSAPAPYGQQSCVPDSAVAAYDVGNAGGSHVSVEHISRDHINFDLAPRYISVESAHFNFKSSLDGEVVDAGQFPPFYTFTHATPKSFTQSYRILLDRHDAVAENSLMIGDSAAADIVPASDAGMPAIMFKPSYRLPEHDLYEATAPTLQVVKDDRLIKMQSIDQHAIPTFQAWDINKIESCLADNAASIVITPRLTVR